MKSLSTLAVIILLAACGRVSSSASQASTMSSLSTLYSCTDDGETTRLTLRHLASGILRADVTVEGEGGSFPTFHYDVTQTQILADDGADKFAGDKFTLTVTSDHKGKLTVSDLGIRNHTVTCRR